MSMLAFDLEQDILKCWNITTDLSEILEDMESGHMEQEEAIRALQAYRQVYERRFEKCFSRFEQFNREVWEMRRSSEATAQGASDVVPSMGKKVRSKSKK